MKLHILQFFEYQHLAAPLQDISKPFCELAHAMNAFLPDNPEKSAALRKILEAKDCAVRAKLCKEPQQAP